MEEIDPGLSYITGSRGCVWRLLSVIFTFILVFKSQGLWEQASYNFLKSQSRLEIRCSGLSGQCSSLPPPTPHQARDSFYSSEVSGDIILPDGKEFLRWKKKRKRERDEYFRWRIRDVSENSDIDGEEVPICFCGYTTQNYVHYMNDVTWLGKGNLRVF